MNGQFTVLAVDKADVDAVRRRDELIAAAQQTGEYADVERYDLEEADAGAAIAALEAPGMFGKRIVAVENLQLATDEHLQRLAAAAQQSDAFAVMRWMGKIPAARRKHLEAWANIEVIAQARGRDLIARVSEEARRAGIHLDHAVRQRIAERVADNPERIAGVMTHLATVGIRRPNLRQVDMVLGSLWGEPAPWDLSDRIEAGEAQAAVAVADRMGTADIATWGYLANRLVDLTLAVEAGADTEAAVAEACGKSGYAAQKLAQLSRRVLRSENPASVIGRLWEIAGRVELDLRSDRSEDALARAVADMAAVFDQQDSTHL